MNDNIFRIFLNLFMASDPWPLSEEENDVLEECLNEEARARGFDGWVVAYHEFHPGEGG